jgi:hypothetical protein
MMKKNNNTLALLAVAAANLTSSQVQAAQVVDKFQFGVRHYNYEEAQSTDFNGEKKDRYDIDVNQFSLIAPLSDQFELSLSYQHEKMSGASPWYNFELAGKPVQVLSGASIQDTRDDASAKLKYVNDLDSFAITAAVSDEDDYKSESFGIGYDRESDDKMSTYGIAADFSNDDIEAVDPELYMTRPQEKQSKHSSSLLLSYSQVLNKNALIQFSAGYSRKTGYLSDPYKMVLANFSLLGDSRPDKRMAKTLSVRYRHFVEGVNAALHLDYRYYDDTWDISSHTIDVAWYQNLPYDIQLIPSMRVYSQSSSYFYEAFYSEPRDDNYYSTDYRLSEYGGYTYGLKLVKSFGDWVVNVSGEKYRSAGDYGFANAEIENPSLVDFKIISVGFDVRF